MYFLISKITLIILTFLLLQPGCGFSNTYGDINTAISNVFKEYNGNYLIYINKMNFRLYLYDRNLEIVNSYKIGYGLNPDKKTKLYSGDKRTPEGIYRITEILSMDADKQTNAYKKLKNMNNVYFKAINGHYKFGKKNVDLGYNVYGPRFFRINYPNNNDIINYEKAVKQEKIPKSGGRIPSIGSGIAIHGNNDKESIGELASSGCIRMYNEDIIELSKYVKLNMPVIISYD